MNDDTTARLKLPLLYAGQAQKELTHNEALALLDCAVQGCVQGVADHPPAAPEDGLCWIVGDDPADAWRGQTAALAAWTGGGWRFVTATEGMAVWDAAAGHALRRIGERWVVQAGTGPRQPAIPDPVGGAAIDLEARAVIARILTALRSHGLIAD